MSETLKNRPQFKYKRGKPDPRDGRWAEEWFEGFETKMLSFKNSKVRCVEWLQKYTMIHDNSMVLAMCQAALRTFIEKEIVGE